MSNSLTKRVLSTSLAILAFMLGTMLIVGIFIFIPYVLENIKDIKSLSFAISLLILLSSYLALTILLLNIVSHSKVSIFVNETVKNFKLMGVILLLDLIVEYISTIIIGVRGMRFIDLAPGIFITPSMAIYFISSLICFVIADSFTSAIKIKNDNDLTI
ncbi:DUF2975 domain-containing protein [Paraclostridium bifermentans]|uniref:DUF2975 domain-containing protein n=1 Tax=Paraclostridium bifermentans TaxID=1490 RepID=UPI00359C1C14